MFVDSHAHLFFKDFEDDLDDVIRRALDVGVDYIICPGTDLETSRKSVELAEKYDIIYASVGFHPHDAKKAALGNGLASANILEEIEKLSFHLKVVAIGEIGLDYHYNFSPPDVQREVFSEQITIARRRHLPIIIHSREAEVDTLRIIEAQITAESSAQLKGVFHCFPGDTAMASKVISWGFFISIPGPVTFPVKPGKSNPMVEVVQRIPAKHILLETDSPYLTPHPYRGKRNEPANITFIAKKIADLRETSVEAIGQTSSLGARKLFGIGK